MGKYDWLDEPPAPDPEWLKELRRQQKVESDKQMATPEGRKAAEEFMKMLVQADKDSLARKLGRPAAPPK
jgi:hypothetical protein